MNVKTGQVYLAALAAIQRTVVACVFVVVAGQIRMAGEGWAMTAAMLFVAATLGGSGFTFESNRQPVDG